MNLSKKILIVEDEPGIQETLRIALESNGFLIQQVYSGEDCLKIWEEGFHLMILDIGLPGIDGFDVLKRVRKKSQIPILLLTARDNEVDRVLGLELEADDYVSKPFSPREIVARIKTILRRSTNTLSKEENIFVHDERKKIIFFQGKSLALSPYEYKTLVLFLKRPGIIFTREEIMDSVWTTPEDSFDRAVDTVIKNIRARIKEINSDLDPIETRRGQGYGLKEI
ncbi:MAG: DNA-binding response regulator [Leptospira sp.]|nr:MAG: DNA-binding response regulator [Leptospira sp.]